MIQGHSYNTKYVTVCRDLYNPTFCSEAVAIMHLKGPSKSQTFVDYLEEHNKHAKQRINTQGLKCWARSIKQGLKKKLNSIFLARGNVLLACLS